MRKKGKNGLHFAMQKISNLSRYVFSPNTALIPVFIPVFNLNPIT
jgi:hypothetical protein